MLKKIRITNFKSFKNSITINFEPRKYTYLETNINKDQILKGVIFVGDNATGKSTILKAIKFLIDLIVSNKSVSFEDYRCVFSSNNSIKLDYIFYFEGKDIEYNFQYMLQKHVLREKLSIGDKMVFNKIGSTIEIQFPEYEYIEGIDKSKSVFSDLKLVNKLKALSQIGLWIAYLEKFVYINNGRDYYLYDSSKYKDFAEYYEKNGVDKINHFLMESKLGFSLEIKRSQLSLVKEEINHKNYNKLIYIKKNNIEMGLEAESEGVIEFVKFMPYIFLAIENNSIICIDEFGSNFNYKLKEIIIKYFMKNSKNSQMCLVSNATNLLSNTIFRPDQEYLVQFDKEGSYINRFSDKKVRECQNVEKMYKENIFV